MKIKKSAILITIFALAILSLPFQAGAVVDWTKDANNPALETGGSGAWDEDGIDRPAVIKDGNTYKMWYSGSGTTKYQVGYATSSDGTTWSKYGSTPVLSPSASGWDSTHVSHCWVIKSGTSPYYKMWYTGTDNVDEEADCQIGYATSPDGINWTRSGTSPVLEYGSGVSDWDAGYAGWPSVIYDAGTSPYYKMWYVGWDETGDNEGIGYATSPDGINWTKYNDSGTTDNP